MDQDFPGIFNLNRNEETKRTDNEYELKTYRTHMNEIYELLLK